MTTTDSPPVSVPMVPVPDAATERVITTMRESIRSIPVRTDYVQVSAEFLAAVDELLAGVEQLRIEAIDETELEQIADKVRQLRCQS